MTRRNKVIIIGIALLALFILMLLSKKDNSKDTEQLEATLIKQSEGDKSKESEADKNKATSRVVATGQEGIVVAGREAPYIEFNQKDYQDALNDGKIIVLNFYAEWCPFCRAEEPGLKRGFNLLGNERIVGFKVNYRDDYTDDLEKTLAEKYGVGYQHTKVIVRNDEVIYKKTITWDEKDVLEILGKLN